MTSAQPRFNPHWRRDKSAAFNLRENSTARETHQLTLWGKEVTVYANANLSIYSGQVCNAQCGFCVEELRPISRGHELQQQRKIETDDTRYFNALERALIELRPLNPTLSITGGEPSKDPRLVQILQIVRKHAMRKITVTTNASGLLDEHDGQPLINHLIHSGVRHLNISRAHWDCALNAEIMHYNQGLDLAELEYIIKKTQQGGGRIRLSCVLTQHGIATLDEIKEYLSFASTLGLDNVVFRQLMKTDPTTHLINPIVRWSDSERVELGPLFDQLEHAGFEFQQQVIGYYYYVEVWRYHGIDVVFEEADLAQLERHKQQHPELVHELIFHPDGRLCSSWQPWDGVLMGG